jgi:hypothetical protein
MILPSDVEFRRLTALSASVLAVALAGCQDAELHRMHGMVTLNGSPVQTGELRLVSPDGSSPTAGAVITEGHYEVTAPPGSKRVEIQAYATIGVAQESNAIPGSPPTPVQKPLLPPKYNVDSQEIVELHGDVEKDFAIDWPTTAS